MFTSFKRACSALAIILLAACAGSSHAGGSAAGMAALPAVVRSSAKISVKIPHRNNPAAVRRYLSTTGRSRGYVSPATQSISITVTDSANHSTTTNASLSVTAAGSAANPVECESGVLSTVCTITLPLGPGTYVLSFATYDGALDRNGAPTGNELSTNQNVPFTVVAGKDNALTVSLAAIPANVSIVPAANEKLVRGNGSPSFALVALGVVHRFNVFAFDADGDPIVGPGAPTWGIGETGPTQDLAVTETTATAPNTFTLQEIAPIGFALPPDPKDASGVSLTLQATPPAGSGVTCSTATCSKTVVVDSVDAAFVGYATGASFFIEGDAESFADTSIAAATSTVDRRNGNIFFATGHTVYEWQPPYDAAPTVLFDEPSLRAVLDLSIDPNGVLYYEGAITSTRNDVFRSAPPYDGHADFLSGFSFADTSHDYHNRILADASGHVFVADDTRIFITQTDLTHQQSIATGVPFITFDGSGELIAFDSSANTLSSYHVDPATNLYALAVKNAMLDGAVGIPLRGETNDIYAFSPMSESLASFSVPLSTGAPDSIGLSLANEVDDFEMTAKELGLITITYNQQGFTEVPYLYTGDQVTAFVAGGPLTLTIVH